MGSVHGYEIDSDLELERLRDLPGARGAIRVRTGSRGMLDRPGELTAADERHGVRFAMACCDGGEIAVHCGATGDYLADPRALTVAVRPAPAAEPAWIEHRLVSVIVPVMLSERGDLVLHAAAVAAGGRALLFAAPSGGGKSTLAMALARTGARLIAEDGVAIAAGGAAGPVAWAGPRGVRLREPGRASAPHGFDPGVSIPGGPEPAQATPLGALVLLGERTRARSPRLRPVPAAVAAARLAPALQHAGGPGAVRRAFARLAAVAGTVPAYEAALPDDLALLEDAAGALLPRLADGAAASRPAARDPAPT